MTCARWRSTLWVAAIHAIASDDSQSSRETPSPSRLGVFACQVVLHRMLLRTHPHRRTFTSMLIATTKHLHREGCRYVQKHGRPATKDDNLPPCLRCMPEAPRLKFIKRECKICNKGMRPCEHNGGVPIVVETRNALPTWNGTYGTNKRIQWYWPDAALRRSA